MTNMILLPRFDNNVNFPPYVKKLPASCGRVSEYWLKYSQGKLSRWTSRCYNNVYEIQVKNTFNLQSRKGFGNYLSIWRTTMTTPIKCRRKHCAAILKYFVDYGSYQSQRRFKSICSEHSILFRIQNSPETFVLLTMLVSCVVSAL